MRKIKLAVVGAGAWSTAMHLPVLQTLARSEAVHFSAVCDRDETRGIRYSRALGADQVHTDMGAMLSRISCDGVVLLVPPAVNPLVIRVAAAHAIPFLVEKPPAPNARVHRALIQAADRLPHLVAYNRRHSPYVLQALKWIKGMRPQFVSVQFSRHRRREDSFAETAVHAIDTARVLAGDDLSEYRIDVIPTGHAWNFMIHGLFRNGAACNIQITPDTGSAEEHYVIRGTDRTVALAFPHRGVHDLPGYVELRQANRVVSRMGPSDFDMAPDDSPALSGIRGEYEAFLSLLRNRRRPTATLAATLQTQEIRDRLETALSRARSRPRFAAPT